MRKIKNKILLFFVLISSCFTNSVFADVVFNSENRKKLPPTDYSPLQSYYRVFYGCILAVIVICAVVLLIMNKNKPKDNQNNNSEEEKK